MATSVEPKLIRQSLACFASPRLFAERFVPGFSSHRLLRSFEASTLRLLASNRIHRQVIEAPVRHGKSYWHSFVVPAWYCCAFPAKKCLGVSYGKELSEEFSADVVRLCEEAGRLRGLRMAWSRRGCFRWADFGGGYDSTTAQGGITGKGYHLICADDLVKDDAEARSPVERARLSKWFLFDCCTRTEPGGKISLVMSRRHMNDLSGECLAANKSVPESKRWASVKFKAIDDAGNALWPERFDLQALQDVHDEWELKGRSYMFDTLYQQNPRANPELCEWPDDYFTGPLLYDELPCANPRLRLLACDPSKGARSKSGDYCAIARMVLTTDNHLYADMRLHRWTSTDVIDNLAAEIIDWKPHAAIVESEEQLGPLMIAVRQRLDAAGSMTPLRPFWELQDKNVRIRLALDEWLARGRIHFRDTLGGALTVNQLKEFPNGEHDDGPDALAMGLHLVEELLA